MQQNTNGQNGGPRPRIEPQYVRLVGDSVGVVNLTPNALQILSDHVTQVLLKIIANSKQYTIHGRRNKMHAEDVDAALKQLKFCTSYYASSKKGPQLRQITAPTGEELYIREEYDFDVANLAEEQKPKFPFHLSLKAHWLAYEGKLALVPENVRPIKDEEDDDVGVNGISSKAAAIALRRETAGGTQGASVSFRQSSRQVHTKENIQIKAPIVESLTVEQQLYIKEVMEAIVGLDEPRRIAALHSLESDTGLQPILPKLSRFIHHAVKYNILSKSISITIYLIRMYKSFAQNSSLKLDEVLHEIVPTLLSCILCSNMCRPEQDNHFALRDFAGRTLHSVISNYGNTDIQERALRVIKQAWLAQDCSLNTKFGCIVPLLLFLTYEDPFNSKFLNEITEIQKYCTNIQNNEEAHHLFDRIIASNFLKQLAKPDVVQKIRERREKVVTTIESMKRTDHSEKNKSAMEVR